MSTRTRFAVSITLALLVVCAGCAGIGKVLGTRYIDLPLGSAGAVDVQADAATAQTTPVAVDSIRFPERLSVANALRVRQSQVEMTPGSGSGTVELMMLIDGYPMANWTVRVEDGTAVDVTPTETFVPGMVRREDYEQNADREPIPREEWEAMQTTMRELPEAQQPTLAEDLPSGFFDGSDYSVDEETLGIIYRGMQQAISNRAFDIAVAARAEGDVSGTLQLDPLTVKFFDSGQRVMGGLE